MALPLRISIITIVLLGGIMSCSGQADYRALIDRGEFSKAREVIHERLKDSATDQKERLDMQFQLERIDRIEKDFTKTEEEVLEYIRQYIPEADRTDLRRWEEEQSVESRIIDGERRYFARAGRNFFRINTEARKIWEEAHKDAPAGERFDLDGHIREVMKKAKSSDEMYVKPVRMRIRYTLSVDSNAVPPGEIIRCWIPYPREIPQRQIDIQYLNSNPEQHIIAPNDQTLQRTIYFERPAVEGRPTTFQVEYEYTSHGVYLPIDPERVRPVEPIDELKPFLREEPPHIVFTDELKELSSQVVGDETNPYRIAQKLFARVDSIPWASAREYSTIENISSYCLETKHGDCGIQTMLFITLCRMNGIPARWQSGWEFEPPDDTMHDWGVIYYAPYGWVPMDVTYGQRETGDEEHRWFYLHGMDSYRLIFNDAYSQPFYPAKIHPRSETVDSQRGEVEWRGGNLYFDQWSWDFDWEVVEAG